MNTYGQIITSKESREVLIITKNGNKISYGYEISNDEIKDNISLPESEIFKRLPKGFDNEILSMDLKLLFKILKEELKNTRTSEINSKLKEG